MVTGAELLSKYPKRRLCLPRAYREIYDEHYRDNRCANTRASRGSRWMERWMHKKVSEPAMENNWTTLEIGAGTLNQLSYESPSGSYDIVEPYSSLYEASPYLGQVRHIYKDINDIDSPNKYGRITSIAVLEHILNLPGVVARSALLLKNNGIFQAAIPSEGTWLWTLGTMYTGREFRKRYGLDYRVLMDYEHVNDAAEIEEVLEFFFKKIRCRVFGLAKSISFYRYYECSLPDAEKAQQYITGSNPVNPINSH